MSKESRLNGLIAGILVGDSMGTPYVFMKSPNILKNAAQACWEPSTPGACSGMFMTSLCCHARHGSKLESLAKYYQRWARRTHDELDLVTHTCFAQKKCQSINKLYARSEASDHGALCSGMLLLRQIPVVIAHMHLPIYALFEHIDAECRLSHADPVSIECAQIYALCIRGILQGKSRLENWNALFQHIQSREVYRIILDSYYSKPVCDNREYSQANTALGIALYHYWHDTPFVSAIRNTVLSGGSTDLNAALTGALMGASQGFKTIPSAWLSPLLQTPQTKQSLTLSTALRHTHIIATHSGYLPFRIMPPKHALDHFIPQSLPVAA